MFRQTVSFITCDCCAQEWKADGGKMPKGWIVWGSYAGRATEHYCSDKCFLDGPDRLTRQILRFLGGDAFIRTAGASRFVGSTTDLSFQIESNKLKATHVRIELEPTATYTLKFLRFNSKLEPTLIKDVNNIQGDDLRRMFASLSGLPTA